MDNRYKTKFSTKKEDKSEFYVEVKKGIFLFLLFILYCSQTFINSVILSFNEAVTLNNVPNNKGVIIQGLFLVISYLIVNVFVNQGWL